MEKKIKRNISFFIKQMLSNSNTDHKSAANCINKPLASFRNKLSLNRFSIDEFLMLADLCDYELNLESKSFSMKHHDSFTLEPEEILSEEDYKQLEASKNTVIEGQLSFLKDLIQFLPQEKVTSVMENYLEEAKKTDKIKKIKDNEK